MKDIIIETHRIPNDLQRYFKPHLCGSCYICHLILIMREVRRVLRPDGVFYLNIGDSWAGSWGNYGHRPELDGGESVQRPKDAGYFDRRGYKDNRERPPMSRKMDGIKPLDMVLIPEQLALAARADGWYVRSVLIWAKGVSLSDEYNGNPMPESVNGTRFERHRIKIGDNGRGKEAWRSGANDTPQQDHDKDGNFKNSAVWRDCPGCLKCEKNGGYVLRKGSWRPTDSYEHILMLTKTGSYFCDREAVSEAVVASTIKRWGNGGENTSNTKFNKSKPDTAVGNLRNGSNPIGNSGRNLRSVLMIPTVGFKGAHFAVFPPRLVEPLIKSATSEKGCCLKCGSPWARIIDHYQTNHDGYTTAKGEDNHNYKRLALVRQHLREHGMEVNPASSTIGWLPTCQCGVQETEPCRVLDCFSGAGTTALVAERLGLDSIGIDTSAEYIQLAEARIAEDEQKRIDEQIKQIKREAKQEARLSNKNGCLVR